MFHSCRLWLIVLIIPGCHPQFAKSPFYRNLVKKLVRVDTYYFVTEIWLLCQKGVAIWRAPLHFSSPNQRQQMGEAWMFWHDPMEQIPQVYYYSMQSYFEKTSTQPICHMLPPTTWRTTFLIMPARCWWGEGARTQKNWVMRKMRTTELAWFQ